MALPDDPLSRDVLKDLERVDGVMTRVIADPQTTEEFIRDPSGVLTRLGLHPETTREIHDRVNRIFYAVLTNTELMGLVADHFATFAARTDEADEALGAALRRGEVEHPPDLDMAALGHVMDADLLRRMFQLTLHDLNDRELLETVHPREDIDDYVDRLVEAIGERRGLRELPVLESWDDHYGVGNEVGVALMFEVGPIATIAAAVEVGLAATVWVMVDGDSVVKSMARSETLMADTARGDVDAARHLATAGAMLKLAGEVVAHAHNFEQR